VVRFTEHHDYRAVIVENVVEVADWLPFEAWLQAMHSLGYAHQMVSLNSMHAQASGLPAPQSRDRLYMVFHKKGNTKPDVVGMQRPAAYCPSCDQMVSAIQSWKKPHHRGVGRYRSQYVYRCPSVKCRNSVVEPAWLPAASIIDWSITGQRIGDRAKPLADKTRRRIAAGIARYWSPLTVESGGNTYDAADPKRPRHGDPNSYYRAWPVEEVLRTLHTMESKALAVPVGSTWSDKSIDTSRDPWPTFTTNDGTGLVLRPFIAELRGGGSTARQVSDPLSTVTASGNHHALITSYYGNNAGALPAAAALPTVTTADRHALIMRNNNNAGDQSSMSTPASEVLRTMTTAGHQSLLTTGDMEAAEAQVDDVLFRMLEPHEVKGAMAFPSDYVILGNRREQVRMCGNAVTPPAARDLVAAVAEALGVAS